jgi:cation transport ATPase
VSDPSSYWTARWCKKGFIPCARSFFALTLAFSGLFLPCVLFLQGQEKFFEAGIAAIICFCTGIAALAATAWQANQQQPLVGMLLAMAIRMLPPLSVCLLLAVQGEGKQYVWFVCYLLVYYLVTLSIETYLSVKTLRR